MTSLIAVEATRDLQVEKTSVETPITNCDGHKLAYRVGLVPILRAGIAMVDPVLDLLPDAEVWHLGLYRDEETAKPIHYYSKLNPESPVDVAMVLDPMLATGGSACLACESIKKWGAKHIRILSIIAAPEGIERVNSEYPDVDIYTCVIDDHLNENKFIVPGLGDAGDRIFNTVD